MDTREIIVDWPDCTPDHCHTAHLAIAEAKARLANQGERALIWEAIRTRDNPETYRVRARIIVTV